MQRFEVSVAVRPIYGLLEVKGLMSVSGINALKMLPWRCNSVFPLYCLGTCRWQRYKTFDYCHRNATVGSLCIVVDVKKHFVQHKHAQTCISLTGSKNCPLGVNTTIGLKNIAATSDDTGRLLSQNGYSCYVFEPSRSISSKWQFLNCVTIAFIERCELSDILVRL